MSKKAVIDGKGISRKARLLVKDFEKAVEEHSWLGAQRPDDWDAIQEVYAAAKQRLMAHIWKLEQDAKSGKGLDAGKGQKAQVFASTSALPYEGPDS